MNEMRGIRKSKKIETRQFLAGSAELCAFLWLALAFSAFAHDGEDHSKDEKAKTTVSVKNAAAPASVVTAERNIENENGDFNFVLRRSPGDPRAGETAQFLVRITEKIAGGFGGGEPIPVDKAVLTARVTAAGRTAVAENLRLAPEADGFYRFSYDFGGAGDYKIFFDVATEDGRRVSADFPVAVARAPIRSSLLAGMTVLSILTLAALASVGYAAKKSGGASVKRIAPLAAAPVLLFAVGTFALASFLPPRETREIAAIPANAGSDSAAGEPASSEILTVTKESQILFGIKTETVAARRIADNLKTGGVVRARPDARAVVVPPVAGRIVLREGLGLGSAVGRGEQIGTVEQILDVSGQTELESQRLEAEAQGREIEARRLEIRSAVLQLEAQQAERRAALQQSRTRLAQARRELERSENLLEAGAAPRKRVEEARTAVSVAEQETASADEQIRLLDNQIRQANAGQNSLRASAVRPPQRVFPLVAPVTGIVNEIKATSGQIIETGSEILTVSNLSTVYIEAQVFERDLPQVRESGRASFTNQALEGEVYTIGTPDGDGRIAFVGQTVNPETRAVTVVYEVKNPLNRLKDGMFVEISIETGDGREALAVPKRAVVSEQGQTFVFVFAGGETFERRAVALGAEGADYYEIKTGLQAGERVVTEGIYQLRSTQPAAD